MEFDVMLQSVRTTKNRRSLAAAITAQVPTVNILEQGVIIKKSVNGAALQLIRDNGGEIDCHGNVSNKPPSWENKTILDESGTPIPFSDGIICRKKTGGLDCAFENAGKVIQVIRVGNDVIIPGRIFSLGAEKVPCLHGCSPDRMCPTNCANNPAFHAKSMDMTARALARA
jgi:hypothetical protein